MRIEDLIALLEQEKAKVAREALEAPPTDRVEYTFGRSVGVYAGLERAKEAILELYRDRADRDKRL